MGRCGQFVEAAETVSLCQSRTFIGNAAGLAMWVCPGASATDNSSGRDGSDICRSRRW